MKVVWETQKIFDDKKIKTSTTAVRIPTFRAHAENVTIQSNKVIDVQMVKSILSQSPGAVIVDDPRNHLYPMAITSNHKYDIEVGKIRANDVFDEYGLDFFISGEQLLKGAALNAVQIAQLTMNKC